MSKNRVQTDEQIEAMVNKEWSEDDDSTDCSDCEVPPRSRHETFDTHKIHDKENIGEDRKTYENIPVKSTNMVLQTVDIALKAKSDKYLPKSSDDQSYNKREHLKPILETTKVHSELNDYNYYCVEDVECSSIDLNSLSAIHKEVKTTDSDLQTKQTSKSENIIDQLMIYSDGENGINMINSCTNSVEIRSLHVQQVTITEADKQNNNILDDFEKSCSSVLSNENSATVLISAPNVQVTASGESTTSYTNQTIENLPVYTEDGLLMFSMVTQALNTCESPTEPDQFFDNFLNNIERETDDILPNESANTGKAIQSNTNALQATTSDEPSVNETPQQTSENGTEITKRGSIRKRKKKSDNPAEEKKKKVEDLAEKHKVLEGCDSNICKMKCSTKISEERRVSINEKYWELGWLERRSFILNTCQRFEVNRHTTKRDYKVRKNTFKYYLKNSEAADQAVCKTFFLTTLGYKKSNDRVLHDVLSKTPLGDLQPAPDKRGKQSSVNKVSDVEFNEHVESFHPTISHYRREHAPNVRYLAADITITLMHNDFKEKYPTVKMSYETYRQKLKAKKISFTRLGHEECAECEALKLHEHKKDNLKDDCETCMIWKSHHEKYTKSRELYRKHAENLAKGTKATHFSADLEKVIMLPRAEGFKEVIFAKRLTVYNECFVPVGEKSATPAYAAVWHEGIAGRCKEQLISTFYAFLVTQRDSESLTIWLDNCASQNKNWCFLSFLVFMINSDIINCKTISIHYFEPGHTYMSADSFHHQIELSLKKMGKAYDFEDFIQAVQAANQKHVVVKAMSHTDFQDWIDYSSAVKLKDKNRPLLADVVELKAIRGDYTLKYKKTYEETEEYKTLDFLKVSATRKGGMSFPNAKERPDGFPKEKTDNILHILKNIIPENRKKFWRDMPTPENNDKDARKPRKR